MLRQAIDGQVSFALGLAGAAKLTIFPAMDIAVITVDGFNELDSFVVSALLNRAGQNAFITTAAPKVKSMWGVEITGQKPLEFANEADAVVIGSGPGTRRFIKEPETLARLRLDPSRQMIASQCSGV